MNKGMEQNLLNCIKKSLADFTASDEFIEKMSFLISGILYKFSKELSTKNVDVERRLSIVEGNLIKFISTFSLTFF